MPYLILTALVALLALGPNLWIRSVMRRHQTSREDLPGTGGELARHLIQRFALEGVTVERSDPMRHHYDPQARAIRLGSDVHDGRSLTAVAVAAHEVGHAIQFARDEPVSRLRRRFVPLAMGLKKAGILLLTLLPVVGVLLHAPAAIFAVIALSLGLQLVGALIYAVILPEEWDASFNKALPLLAEGEYVPDEDLPAVREVLRAAALTYVAAALADLVNISRWALILRR